MSTRSLVSVGLGLLAAGVTYGLLGLELSDKISLITMLLAWVAGAAWLRHDASAHHIDLVYDWGWLVGVGWPVLWIWYCRRTGRSWSFALVLAALPLALSLGALFGFLLRALLFQH